MAVFRDASERAAARDRRVLGRFTLAVETAAVYLGQYEDGVSCAGFRDRLKAEGLPAWKAPRRPDVAVRHGEKSLASTFARPWNGSTRPEQLALPSPRCCPPTRSRCPGSACSWPSPSQSAATPPPAIPTRGSLSTTCSACASGSRRASSMPGRPLVARMHRLLQELMKTDAGPQATTLEAALLAHIKTRANFLWDGWVQHEHRWELPPLARVHRALAWHRDGDDAPLLARLASGPLGSLGQFAATERLDPPEHGDRRAVVRSQVGVHGSAQGKTRRSGRSLTFVKQVFYCCR